MNPPVLLGAINKSRHNQLDVMGGAQQMLGATKRSTCPETIPAPDHALVPPLENYAPANGDETLKCPTACFHCVKPEREQESHLSSCAACIFLSFCPINTGVFQFKLWRSFPTPADGEQQRPPVTAEEQRQ